MVTSIFRALGRATSAGVEVWAYWSAAGPTEMAMPLMIVPLLSSPLLQKYWLGRGCTYSSKWELKERKKWLFLPSCWIFSRWIELEGKWWHGQYCWVHGVSIYIFMVWGGWFYDFTLVTVTILLALWVKWDYVDKYWCMGRSRWLVNIYVYLLVLW